MEEFKLPDVGKTTCIKLPEHRIFVEIECTDVQDNPSKDDGFGVFYSFNTKHINYCEPADLPEEYKEYSVMLGYTEHGNCRWSLSSAVKNDFDSRHAAGFWYPDASIVQEIPAELKEDKAGIKTWMEERASSACKTYTDWCNGEVFDYAINVYLNITLTGKGIESTVADDIAVYNSMSEPFDSYVGGMYYGSDFDENGLEHDLRHDVERLVKEYGGAQ